MKYKLINKLLAKKEPYTDDSWQIMPVRQLKLQLVELTLEELEKAKLLPNIKHDELAIWLLHNSPLTEFEKSLIHFFLFECDYY